MGSPTDSALGSDGNLQPQYRSGDSTPRRVLEDVLKQTAALNSAEQGIQLANMDVLIEVARRLRGIEFGLNPVVIELVRATLAGQLKDTGQSSEQFMAVSERVARTLFDNPETQERLHSLWARLSSME